VTDPDSSKDLELGLELEPELELQPDDAPADTSPSAADESAGVEGQWVWQYAAPPPPPSFLAVFFSGTAHKELYRFFACSLLVVIGCLLPWGPVMQKGVPDLDGVSVETVLPMPDVMGYETPAGAISLMLGLWLMFSSCYGIYTRRQKILPVFLMLEPAAVTLLRTMDAWGKLKSESTLDKLVELFEVAGSGVMLTLIGSGFVAIGFLFLLGKVYTKKDDKGSGRRPAREKDTKKGGASGRKGKGSKKADAKDTDKDAATAEGAVAAEGAASTDAGASTDSASEETVVVDASTSSADAGDAGKPAGGVVSSRRSRGRRR
jgi:hypothetical protein